MTKRLIRLSITLTLVGLFTVVGYLLIRQEHETIEFSDPNLEVAIRSVINNPSGPITRNQVRTITVLDVANADIEYLGGIEALSSLRTLNLESNQIQDLTPLSTLNNLESLNLRNNAITSLYAINLNALSDLDNLRELNLRHNVLRPDAQNPNYAIRISDIRILEDFTQLETLILRDNDIQDTSPLSSLTNLITLDISQNPIFDTTLSALSRMHRLESLNIRETGVTHLDVLRNLTSLTYLNLHSNIDIETLEPIAHLINLDTLILQNVPVGEEIVYLSNLDNLSRLNLRNTGIDDVSIIVSLMERGALQDVPAFNNYAELDLRDNPIPIVGSDSPSGYNPLRDYWRTITYRYPYVLPLDPTREIIINEYMSSNGDSLMDVDGDHEDWIELYNPTSEAINISGYYLSDDSGNPFRWQFPENTIIEAHSFLLVWASGKDKVAPNGEIHTNFSISRSGEPLILTAPDRITLVDQIVPMALPRNVSYGRYPNGSDNWVFFDRNNITPNATNNHATPYDIPDWLNPNN